MIYELLRVVKRIKGLLKCFFDVIDSITGFKRKVLSVKVLSSYSISGSARPRPCIGDLS